MPGPILIPTFEEIAKINKSLMDTGKIYIIDPKDVSPKDDTRIRSWASEMMKKHENKLGDQWQNMQIVTSGTVESEDIDIKAIYPFEDLNWLIFREGQYWSIMIRAKEKFLAKVTYAKF